MKKRKKKKVMFPASIFRVNTSTQLLPFQVNVKGKVVSLPAVKAQRGVEECIHPLLNSTLDAGGDTFTSRPLYPFTTTLGGHQTWSGLFGYEKKPVSLPETKKGFLGHPCHYLVTTPTTDSLRAGRSRDRIPVGARFSPPVHTQSPTQRLSGLSRRKSGRGLASTTHHHLAPRLKKQQRYTSTPPLGLRGLFQGDLYLYYTDYTTLASCKKYC